MSEMNTPVTGFEQMNLHPTIYPVLQKQGYHTPTPIQILTIPHLNTGKDMIGQAKTGTGKTAAFALPLLSRIDIENKRPQILVLTPTRELAIQVAESFKTYGSGMKGLNVLSVYGGQSYSVQLTQLKKGVHVVVGTPGRLMDHMRRKTITLADLFSVIIDEADEMLHMGFIEDVEWILEQTPDNIQTALFSATMPPPIRKIAQKYLTAPKEIFVKPDNSETGTIHQKFWLIQGTKKADALIRILEATTFEGVIVFVKTKATTLDVAKALEARGFKAEALNGDLAQAARERTVRRLKNGYIDILVATDVAARGLDVDRISHVINYDMPSKVEPYIHRIGRTGRAGRTGEAILFVGRNESWMLKNIERATKQPIKELALPSNTQINKKRIDDFKKAITHALTAQDLDIFENLVEAYAKEQEMDVIKIAAALAKAAHGDTPFLYPSIKKKQRAQNRYPLLRRKNRCPEKKRKPLLQKAKTSQRLPHGKQKRSSLRPSHRMLNPLMLKKWIQKKRILKYLMLNNLIPGQKNLFLWFRAWKDTALKWAETTV
ncbi:MAG: DEAD/DEAH box helicase [Proteobacteria bacterium]|nr:DEAD/DEAH box helicase [Pseudomonadota bacterium]